MALVTLVAEHPFVPVVVLVAVVTCLFNLDPVWVLFMAVITTHFPVPPLQWKFSLFVMIKLHLAPTRRLVAFGAVLPFFILVHIVGLVAGITTCRRINIFILWMTIGAGGIPVLACQLEFGFIVIVNNLFPVTTGVTRLTLLLFILQAAKPAPMGIVFLVTTFAATLGLTVFFMLFMAGSAFRYRMFTLEGKIRIVVIECIGIQFDNIFLAALVFSVAILALLFAEYPAVVTPFIADIG